MSEHKCECPLAGYCYRHKREKGKREHDICQGVNVTLAVQRRYLMDWGQVLLPAKPPLTTPMPGQIQIGNEPGGVGAELKKLLRWFDTPGCKCKQRAAELDRAGIVWCEANVDAIVGWLHEEATNRKVLGWSLDQVPGFDKGAAWLVGKAIRNAREAEKAKPNKFTRKHGFKPLISEPIDRAKLQSHILYHVMPVAGDTEWVWRKHLVNLREIRSHFKGRLIVGIVTDGRSDHWQYHSPEAVREMLNGLDAEYLTAPNDVRSNAPRAGMGEGTLFTQMLAMLETDDPNHVMFYGHCKGVTRPGGPTDAPHKWSDAMFETLFRNHDATVKLLDRKGAAGPFLMRGGRGPGRPGVGMDWFFSGTFFAMRLVDLFRRNWRHLPLHYGCVEQFPRCNFSLEEVGCTFFDDVDNLYDEMYWAEKIQPALNKWREENGRIP